jgi:hypothetical protein
MEWTHVDVSSSPRSAIPSPRHYFGFAAVADRSQGTCPYGEGSAGKFVGCDYSYNVNVQHSDKEGGLCPHTHTERLIASHKFGAYHYRRFAIEAASKFTPDPDLFDKSEDIAGDESYERMLNYHIQGLMHPKIVQIEDKIYMKELLQKLAVPMTTTYFGAHKSDWDREAFSAALIGLCEQGVGRFIIKATHLAWSKGQKIVTDWDKTCEDYLLKGNAGAHMRIQELAEFIEAEALDAYPNEEDMHLTFLEPGVTVEELFNSGGASGRPLELKVVVLWGKAYHAFVVGSDTRGCEISNGAWEMYPDGTGWNLNGLIGKAHDDEFERVKPLLPQVFAFAETFAKGIGADYTRADFFVGWDEDGTASIKMNEGELVSGAQNLYDRTNLAGMWRDGYIANGNVKLNEDKYRVLKQYLKEEWDRHVYDPKPSEVEKRVSEARIQRKASKSSPGPSPASSKSSSIVRAVGVEEDPYAVVEEVAERDADGVVQRSVI